MSERTMEEKAREWLNKCAMADFIEHEMGPSDHPNGDRWNDTDSASLASLLTSVRNEALREACEAQCPSCRDGLPIDGEPWHLDKYGSHYECHVGRIRALVTK